jgi:osmotically-inducible protein OsmY
VSASEQEVKGQIAAALVRQASADSSSIHVDTAGGTVTLSGTATSWQAIADARDAAWAAPGVTQVIDRVDHNMTVL